MNNLDKCGARIHYMQLSFKLTSGYILFVIAYFRNIQIQKYIKLFSKTKGVLFLCQTHPVFKSNSWVWRGWISGVYRPHSICMKVQVCEMSCTPAGFTSSPVPIRSSSSFPPLFFLFIQISSIDTRNYNARMAC